MIAAYEKGSVITIDNSISVFAGLVKSGSIYEENIFPIIIKHIETCRPKEVGQYSERAFICITNKNAELFRKALLKRYNRLTEPQRKRVSKLIKNIDEGRYN